MATPLSQDNEHSMVYKALRANYCNLVEAVSRGQIPGALFQEELIDANVLGVSSSAAVPPKEVGEKIMLQVLQAVKLKPDLFESFCKALEKESVTNDVLEQLKSEYLKYNNYDH